MNTDQQECGIKLDTTKRFENARLLALGCSPLHAIDLLHLSEVGGVRGPVLMVGSLARDAPLHIYLYEAWEVAGRRSGERQAGSKLRTKRH